MSGAGPSGVPPRKALTAKARRRLEKLVADKEKMAQIRADVKASESFDHSAPGDVAASARTRAPVEKRLEEVYGSADTLDEVTIRIDWIDDPKAEEDPVTARRGRLERHIVWTKKADRLIPKAGRQCPLCLADPTQPQEAKDSVYSLAKLNIHLRSGAHSRRAQLLRAINMDLNAKDDRTTLSCPICGSVPQGETRKATSKMMLAHIEKCHPAELWEGESEAMTPSLESTTEKARAGPSASRPAASSPRAHDIGEAADVEAVDIEAGRYHPIVQSHEQLQPYTGKGKGKAAIRD